MAKISLETVRGLDQRIQWLLGGRAPNEPVTVVQLAAVRTHVDALRARLPEDARGEDLPAGATGWDSLDERVQAELHEHLKRAHRSLVDLLDPGPDDPASYMYREYASNEAIGGLWGYTVALVLFLGAFVSCTWNQAMQPDPDHPAQITTSEVRRQSAELGRAVDEARALRKEAAARQEELDRALAGARLGLSSEGAEGDGGQAEPEPATDDGAEAPETPPNGGAAPEPPQDPGAAGGPDAAVPDSEAIAALRKAASEAEDEADGAELRMRVSATLAGRALNGRAGPAEWRVLLTVVLLGALGGTLRLLSSMVRYAGYGRLRRSWISYYVAMPVQGALLAPIVYLLLRVGILAPSMTGESGTADLNLIGIYGFSALTGLFANQALLKLRDVFDEIFRSKQPQVKDSLQGENQETAG